MTASPVPAETNQSRWLGLRSYDEGDSSLFFGRNQDSERLLRMVRREVLTIVFAPSGTGKTSLLRAGLFPRLRENGFLPVWIRLDHSGTVKDHRRDIREQLEGAAADENLEISTIVPPQVDSDEETFWEYMHRIEFWDQNNELVTPVIVIDQFEEVFTIGRGRPETSRFLSELADIVQKRIPKMLRERLRQNSQKLAIPIDTQTFRFVLSLRQDFVPQLDNMRKSMPMVMRNRYPLHQMTGPQALQAVLGPGEGIIEPKVARRIVEIVGGTASGEHDNSPRDLADVSVEPNHLSLVCHELDQARINAHETQISPDRLEEQSHDILRRFYVDSFEGLPREAQIFVEENLLTATGYRTSQPLDDAELRGLTQPALRQLVDRHVLRIDDRRGMSHVELTHDLLTGVVQESRDRRHEEEEKARLRSERQSERKRRQMYGIACSVLVAFLAGAIFLAVRANKAETVAASNAARAERNAQTAEENRQKAEQLLSFMTNDLYDRLRPIGRLDLLQEVAMKAQSHLESTDLDSVRKESRSDQARARNRVANVLLLRGFLRDAMESQRQAIALLLEDIGLLENSEPFDVDAELTGLLIDYAETHSQWDRPQDALTLLAKLPTAAKEDVSASWQERELSARQRLVAGRAHARLGQTSKAESLLRRGIEEIRNRPSEPSEDEATQRSAVSLVADFQVELAKLQAARQNYPEAFRLTRDALAEVGSLNAIAPENKEWILQKATLLAALGELHLKLGDTDGASDKFNPALVIAQRELADHGRSEPGNNSAGEGIGTVENPQWRRLVVQLHRDLGRVALANHRYRRSSASVTDGRSDTDKFWRDHFDHAIQASQQLPANEINQLLTARVLSDYGVALGSLSDTPTSLEMFQAARDIFHHDLDVHTTANPTILLAYATACREASNVVDQAKVRIESDWFDESRATLRRILDSNPNWVRARQCHADLLEKHADWLGSEARILEAIALFREALKDREVVCAVDSSVAPRTRELARAHAQLGDFTRWSDPLNVATDEVIGHFRTSHQLFASLANNNHWWVEDRLKAAESLSRMATLLAETGNAAEAMTALQQASELGAEQATKSLIEMSAAQSPDTASTTISKTLALRQQAKQLWIPCVLRDELINDSAGSAERHLLAPLLITGPIPGVAFDASSLAEEFHRLESEQMLQVAPDARRELEDWWFHLSSNPEAEVSLAQLADQGLSATLDNGAAPVRLEFPIGRLSEDRPATIIGRECTLRWTYQGSQRDQRDFRLQVSRDPEFKTAMAVDRLVSGTSFRCTFDSEEEGLNGSFYWRIRSERANGNPQSSLAADSDRSPESWSDVGYFEVYKSLVKRIETTATLRVGLFEFDGDLLELNPGESEWSGFNGELNNHLRQYLAEEILGDPSKPLKVNPYKYSWNGMFEAASRAEVDLAVSVITRTKEREHRYDVKFSEPYFETRFALVSNVADPIDSIEMLRQRGAKVLVNQGFRGEQVARMLIRDSNAVEPTTYQKVSYLLDSVIEEKAVAAFTDDAFVLHHLAEFPEKAKSLHIVRLSEEDYGRAMIGANDDQLAGLKEMSEDFGGAEYEQYAVALSPKAEQLRRKINDAILRFRETIAKDACERANLPPAPRLYEGKQRLEDELRLATVISESPNERTGAEYVIGDEISFTFYPILVNPQRFHLQISTSREFSPLTIVKTVTGTEGGFTLSGPDDGIPEGTLYWRAKATSGPKDLYPHRGWCEPAKFKYYRSCLSRIKSTGKLRVAVNLSNGRSVFRNEAGQLDGFDVRIMELLSRELAEEFALANLEVEFVEGSFSELFDHVRSRLVDMAISGITKTDAREAKYQIKFSDAYCRTCQAAVCTKAARFEDAKAFAGRRLIVAGKTRAFQVASALSPVDNVVTIRTTDGTSRWGVTPKAYLLEQVAAGNVDAAIMDYQAAIDARAQQRTPDNFVITPLRRERLSGLQVETEDRYAIALPADQDELTALVNACFQRWKSSETQPLRKILSRYQPEEGEQVFEIVD